MPPYERDRYSIPSSTRSRMVSSLIALPYLTPGSSGRVGDLPSTPSDAGIGRCFASLVDDVERSVDGFSVLSGLRASHRHVAEDLLDAVQFSLQRRPTCLGLPRRAASPRRLD